MFGPDNYARVQELGIIPRSVDYMFKLLNDGKNILKYQISLSICEVYKEMLRDLLTNEKSKNRKRLEILSAGKDVTVKNLTEKPCENVGDILKYIVMAQSNRAKHTTDFIGHDSSRSHCVVMISVTQRLLDDTIKFSKLNFGDLAGSELAAKTGTSGTNLKEAGKIHQGLLALENVINALVEKKKHVPYNDSKLTRLLSTSIGGNSKTTLLVTCSPSIWNRDETISTLRFAKRAKKIKNKAKINKRKTREQLEARIIYLENENANLKKKLNKRKFGGSNVSSMKKNNTMSQIVDGDGDKQIFGMSAEEKKQNDDLLQNKDDEIRMKSEELEKLKQLLDKKDDQMKQLEDDLEIKQELVDEFGKEKVKYEKKIDKLSSEVIENNAEIDKLQTKLDTNIELQTKFNAHTENLSKIVDDSVKDSNNSMISALTEITKQQAEFYNFLKNLSTSIEKIHEKQISNERDINNRFDDVNQMILGIGNNGRNGGGYGGSVGGGNRQYGMPRPVSPSASYNPNDNDEELSMISNSEYDPVTPRLSGGGRGGHFAQQSSFNFDENALANIQRDRNLSVASLVISPEQLRLEPQDSTRMSNNYSNGNNKKPTVNKDDAEVLTDLISSMKSYLDKTREQENSAGNSKVNGMNKNRSASNTATFFGGDEFKINDEDAKSYKSNYSIGKKVDVLDVSYNWYSATIIDIDVFDKKAVYIKYDEFEDRWNEWIPLSKSHRISPHRSRTNVGEMNPALKSDRGGCHALITTKFGKSRNALELQEAFSSDKIKTILSTKSILMQGHLYKRSNWNKKNWKRRWFVIRNNHNIYYYDHKNMKSKQYRGVISLGAISIVQIAKKKGYTRFSFNIRTHKNRKHRFSCANEQDLVDWVSVLECLIWGDCDKIELNKPGKNKAVYKTVNEDDPDFDNNDDRKNNDDSDDDSDNDSDGDDNNNNNNKKAKRPITPRIRGSVSAIASKFKQLTNKSSSPRPPHQGPYVATIKQIE